ncbi:hypothetical protein GCM10020000_10060 [Streptomyces olivoverticillatus]
MPTPMPFFEAFSTWAEERGITLYPAQEEALIEVVSGANVILSTPTGSGKSLVAAGAHFTALANDQVTFYTAPIKALVSEKFFSTCARSSARRTSACSPATPPSTRTHPSSAARPRCSPPSRCGTAGTPTSARS